MAAGLALGVDPAVGLLGETGAGWTAMVGSVPVVPVLAWAVEPSPPPPQADRRVSAKRGAARRAKERLLRFVFFNGFYL